MRIEPKADGSTGCKEAGPPEAPAHHLLEDILGWSLTRRVLHILTRLDGKRTCFFERACESYNNAELTRRERFKWYPVEVLVDHALARTKLDKSLMTKKLFHHQPAVCALALAGRSIASTAWRRLRDLPLRSLLFGT